MINKFEADIDACLKEFFGIYKSRLQSIVNQTNYWIACGSTKTGIETGLSGLSNFKDKVPQVIDYYIPAMRNSLAIGLTYSGNSTEVTDFIPYQVHPDSIIITNSTNLQGAHVLKIAAGKVPLRYLPLVTHKLMQLLYGIELPKSQFLGDWLYMLEPVFEILNFAYINNRIPVFIADNNSWFARLFAEQYMECLKRPAFYMNYPNFTHNILWTFSGENIDKFCFIHENSQQEYSDNRQKKTIKHIESLGGIQSVLPFDTKRCDTFLVWLLSIKAYESISQNNGLNINLEYSFGAEN